MDSEKRTNLVRGLKEAESHLEDVDVELLSSEELESVAGGGRSVWLCGGTGSGPTDGGDPPFPDGDGGDGGQSGIGP